MDSPPLSQKKAELAVRLFLWVCKIYFMFKKPTIMQNIDQCIKPALLIVNFFYINVKIDLVKINVSMDRKIFQDVPYDWGRKAAVL